jgi:hypothetical protein
VLWGQPLPDILNAEHIARDFEYGAALNTGLSWIHRHTSDADIYFVANRSDRSFDTEARFRVSGKEAELWHPDTGETEPAGYTIADGRTIVPLRLAERESVFVVFRRPAASPTRVLPRMIGTTLATVNDPWTLSFPPNLGAPPNIQVAQLESWTANADPGVKYFSGTATYTKNVQAPLAWFHPGAKVMLDLGTVKDLAEVSINGKAMGILWKAPYQVDATGALKPGPNRLEIKVTNEWTNRLIGDRLGPTDKRVLASSGPAPGGRGGGGGFGLANQTPIESGLIGPVTVISVEAR